MSDIILGFETSTNICGIYILKDGELLDTFYSDQKNKHDQLLAQETMNLLSKNGIEMNQIDAISAPSGPGSFTGLRIGVSFAKGLAFARNIPIIPISFFELCNNYIDSDNHLDYGIILPSHSDIYYFANARSFLEDGAITTLSSENILKFNLKLVGESRHESLILQNKGNPISFANLRSISIKKYENKSFINHEDFKPNYHQEFKIK